MVDLETAGHPALNISMPHALMSPNQGETAVCGSYILCWMTGRRSLVATNRALCPLAMVSVLLTWSSDIISSVFILSGIG